MDMDEQTIYMDEEEELSYYKSITGFIQNNGWYFLLLFIILAYIISKLWPHYVKWSERRAEAAYDADVKKNPDLYKQKQEELQKARIKFQEEYEIKAKIAMEKQKQKEEKLLEEKRALLNKETNGKSIKSSQKSKNFKKPDYNPLMGSGSGSNYRPPRRSACSGGGCG